MATNYFAIVVLFSFLFFFLCLNVAMGTERTKKKKRQKRPNLISTHLQIISVIIVKKQGESVVYYYNFPQANYTLVTTNTCIIRTIICY